jgi:hypothetical protein
MKGKISNDPTRYVRRSTARTKEAVAISLQVKPLNPPQDRKSLTPTIDANGYMTFCSEKSG